MTTLTLIRHGETDWNATRRIQGQLDVPLNEVGRAQADAIAHRFRDDAVDVLVPTPLHCDIVCRALRAGLHETNTSERYKRLAEAGQLPAADMEGWIAAFEFFQLMRLRAQHRREHAYGASHEDNPNEVELRSLSPLDRRILNESFRQARKVQQRLELDFPG